MKKIFNNKEGNIKNIYQENETTKLPDKKEKFNFKNLDLRRISKIVGLILIGFILSSMMNPYKYTAEQYETLNKKNTTLKKDYEDIKSENEILQSENNDLQAKVDEAAPWFEMKESERKAQEEQIAKEKADAEAKEKAEAEAKEKQGYDTGITYSQLARTPDDYMFQKVKFKGKVIQVMEGTDSVQIRLAVGGNYDNILLCEYSNDIVKSRILEDDSITVYGLSAGLITYESTMGGNITIPSVAVSKIDN